MSSDVSRIGTIISFVNVQLLTRVLTFGINLCVARFSDPKAFGIAQVSFGLLETLTLCVLKEGFRRTALRSHSNQTLKGQNSQSSDNSLNSKSLQDGTKKNGISEGDFASYDKNKFDSRRLTSSWRSSLNISSLGSIVCILGVIFLSLVWLFLLEVPSPSAVNSFEPVSSSKIFNDVTLCYQISIGLVSVGVALQALAEPFVIQCLLQQQITTRAKFEGYAIVAKSITTPLVLLVVPKLFKTLTSSERFSVGLLSFALSHVSFGLVWLLAFWNKFSSFDNNPSTQEYKTKVLKHLPQQRGSIYFNKLGDGSYISQHHRQLLPSFLILAFEKVLLNEIERLTLLLIFSSEAWAVYGLVSNLGSTVCRLIFAPIEEIAAVTFSVGQGDERQEDTSNTELTNAVAPSERMQEKNVSKRCTNSVLQHRTSKQLQLPLLGLYIGCEGFIGLCGMTLSSPVSAAILYLLYGSKWVSTGSHFVLQRYCIYLFFLSLNGILEAFMYSKGSPQWLSLLRWLHAVVWLMGISTIIVLKFFFLRGYGKEMTSTIQAVVAEVSVLILGNVISVILRILICLYFLFSEVCSVISPNSHLSIRSKLTSCRQILKESFPKLFLIPALSVIFASVGLWLVIQIFLAGGIELFISNIILQSKSPEEAHRLLELKRPDNFKSILLLELFFAFISAVFVMVCSVGAFLRSGIINRRKIT